MEPDKCKYCQKVINLGEHAYIVEAGMICVYDAGGIESGPIVSSDWNAFGEVECICSSCMEKMEKAVKGVLGNE